MSTESLLADLESEVRGADPLTADRLRELQNALVPEADARGWLGLSPFDVIDVESVANRVTKAGSADTGAAWKEVLRNTLIMMPILITWLSLFVAGYGYQEVIKQDPNLIEQPFLVLWEQGFRGMIPLPIGALSFLSLWVVSLIDVVLISAVIFLTWRIQRQVSVVEAQRQQAARDLAGRLHDGLAGAALELSRRSAIPSLVDTLRQSAAGLTAEIRAERTRLSRAGDDTERVLNELRGVARDLRDGAQEFVEATRLLAPMFDRINATSNTIATSVTAANAAQDRLARAIGDQTDELRHEHTRLDEMTSEVRNLAEVLMGTIEGTLPAYAQQLTDAEVGLRTEVGNLRGALEADRQNRIQVDQSIAQVTATIGQLQRETANVQAGQQGANQSLGQVARQLEALTRDMDATLRRQVELADRIERSLNSMASAVDRVSRMETRGR